MTAERLLDFATGVNPGFFVILAALLAAVAKDGFTRAVALVGGPILALVLMLARPLYELGLGREPFLGFELAPYRPDSLSLIFALGFVIAAVLGGIYSLHRRDRLQDAAGLVYAGAAMGVVFAGDLLTLLVCAELSTVAGALLVFAARTGPGFRAGMRFLTLQVLAGLLMTAGVALVAAEHGTLLVSDLAGVWNGVIEGGLNPASAGGALFLAGIGIKAAFPLFHNWLTDAYPNTTETGAVVMSPYTTTMAVYLLARFFPGYEPLIWIGAAMTIYPVFFAVMENDLRRVLAYSTNNQIGFMVCAVGIGTPLAINGASAHAVTHIVFKGLLFMTMGAVQLRLGTTKATELGGLHRTMPWTTLACLVGAASISALPLLAGYASKTLIMGAAEYDPALFAVWLMLLFASAGVLEHSGIKIPFFAFFGHDSGKRPQEAPFTMLLAMGLSAGICLAIGLMPGWLYTLLPVPYPRGQEFGVANLFDAGHLILQLQLLAFAVLAFMVLRWWKLYPDEQRGIILDVEWVWRRGWPELLRPLARAGSGARQAVTGLTNAVGRSAGHASRQVFASGGWVSSKTPLGATAVCALAILGIVLALSLAA